MAKTAALGDGPIVFFSDGEQLEVPLSDIYFEGDKVDTVRTDLPTGFNDWIKFLASRGRLVADVAPPAEKAIVVIAAVLGTSGNDIQLKVEAKSLPGVTPVTFDVTVTETDRYPGLTLATLVAQLGMAGAVSDARLGLLTVNNNPFPPGGEDFPVGLAQNIPMTAGAPPTWTIASAAGEKILLQPRRPGTEFDAADSTTVSISDAPATPTADATFTLTVTWTRIARDVALGNLSVLDDLKYLVTFTAPDGTAITPTNIKLPRPGTYTLTGGSEPVAATLASATVLADE